MKEFLSAVREFDLRVRHEDIIKTVVRSAERKTTEAWWLKSNYVSLSDLLVMMHFLGFWSTGGTEEAKGKSSHNLLNPCCPVGSERIWWIFSKLHMTNCTKPTNVVFRELASRQRRRKDTLLGNQAIAQLAREGEEIPVPNET